MISLGNLSVHFDGEYLFENVSVTISDRDKIGLVGRNGAGKTTLLRMIAGEVQAENGQIVIPAGSTIGYLPQEKEPESNKTVFDEALNAFSEIKELERKISAYQKELDTRTDYDSDAYLKLINKLSESNDKYLYYGGQTMEADTEKVLKGLGFLPSDFHRPLKEFSSGWQMRVELAKILLKKPDIILLDEPTNHLDIESIQWVEEFLKDYIGIIILVSHDRAFLDNVTSKTIEISMGKIFDYKAPYSDYVIMREERLEKDRAAFNNQQREIDSIERFIERFRYKNTKARQVQSRVKMLDKMKMVEVDEMDQAAMYFRFPAAPRSGKVVYTAKDIEKKYDENLVLDKLNLVVTIGERIAFVGKNGEGKTTLSKIIVGKVHQTDGVSKLGYNVSVGYFAQNQSEMLDPNKSVFETIDDVATGDMRTRVRSILGNFLFSGDEIDKRVKVLSGGEKARLALAKLLLLPVNLLVLDEPTNHLDMRSKDILKNALLQYDGTLIIVSHDRYFMDGLINKVYEFRNQGIKEFVGEIYEFLESRKLESLKELETRKGKPNLLKESKKATDNKQRWENKKLFEREIRKVKNSINKCENEIDRLENEIKERDERLINPNEYKELLNSKEFYS
ncbi:ABC-F family ATP-binding cassette domain-containing protein, partial [candidate division KSB1 bacterium]